MFKVLGVSYLVLVGYVGGSIVANTMEPGKWREFWINFFISLIINNVYPHPWQLSFQEPATAMMSGIIDLHHDIMAILVFILGFVSVLLLTILFLFSERKLLDEPYMKILQVRLHRQNYYSGYGITYHTFLETVWTIIPTIVLLVIATPSFALIYALDEVMHPELTVRIVGRQWYWNYEYPDGFKHRHQFGGLPPLVGQSIREMLIKMGQHLQLDPSSLDEVINSTNNDAHLSSINSEDSDNITLLTTIAKPPYDSLDWDHTAHFEWLMEATKTEFSWQGMADLNYNRRAGDFHNGPLWGHFITDPRLLTTEMEFPPLRFDSYMLGTDDLPFGSFRLLEVDKRLVLPVNTCIRFLVTSDDVLHSWTVPSFGIKVDAVPGRTNEYYLLIQKCGVYYGQCSEICGVNHGFMPIKVEVIPSELVRFWYLSMLIEEFDDEGETPPFSYFVNKRVFFRIVDELIPFFCDNHGYTPIELQRKAVQCYYDGGLGVTHFLGFRHIIANFKDNIALTYNGYTLKPTVFDMDLTLQRLIKQLNFFAALGYTAEYVEKYSREDFDITRWRNRLAPDFYEVGQLPNFSVREFVKRK